MFGDEALHISFFRTDGVVRCKGTNALTFNFLKQVVMLLAEWNSATIKVLIDPKHYQHVLELSGKVCNVLAVISDIMILERAHPLKTEFRPYKTYNSRQGDGFFGGYYDRMFDTYYIQPYIRRRAVQSFGLDIRLSSLNLEGLGTLTTKNGVTYDGNWTNDKKHGYGLVKKKLNSRRIQRIDRPIYDGEWKLNKRTGDGTAYYENGFYEGQWKNGCRDGLGIMTFYDGGYFIGEWKNGLYDGIGSHYDVNSGTFYRGYFRNGIKCGEGTLNNLLKRKIQKGIWIDGSCVTSIVQDDDQTLPKNIIPEIGLADPVSVITESLQRKDVQNKMTKFKVKKWKTKLAFNSLKFVKF